MPPRARAPASEGRAGVCETGEEVGAKLALRLLAALTTDENFEIRRSPRLTDKRCFLSRKTSPLATHFARVARVEGDTGHDVGPEDDPGQARDRGE